MFLVLSTGVTGVASLPFTAAMLTNYAFESVCPCLVDR